MATPDQKSPNVLLQNLCCRILGRSEADVAQQFQFAVRVIGSNFAPTVERDEFLVAEKIKKELIRQRREADAALFSELHRKLHSQTVSSDSGSWGLPSTAAGVSSRMDFNCKPAFFANPSLKGYPKCRFSQHDKVEERRRDGWCYGNY